MESIVGSLRYCLSINALLTELRGYRPTKMADRWQIRVPGQDRTTERTLPRAVERCRSGALVLPEAAARFLCRRRSAGSWPSKSWLGSSEPAGGHARLNEPYCLRCEQSHLSRARLLPFMLFFLLVWPTPPLSDP